MAGVLEVALRGAQFLWALLLLALMSNVIHDAIAGNPSIVNYDEFVAIFSMLSLIYLIPASIMDFGAPIINIGLDVLNTLFYFCGAVATAAYLGAHSCSDSNYTRSNFVTNGAANSAKRCRETQASTAFMFFNFLLFAVSAVLSAMAGRGSGVNLRGGIGGIRRGPAMSQV